MTGERPLRIWSAKLRQPTDAAERLICASGQDAFFLRPSSSSTLPAEDKFAIVWGAKHADCSPTLLAELLQRAQQVPGHRGLARSMIGIGLRSPWTSIKLARRSFAPHDQRFTDDNTTFKVVFPCHSAWSEQCKVNRSMTRSEECLTGCHMHTAQMRLSLLLPGIRKSGSPMCLKNSTTCHTY